MTETSSDEMERDFEELRTIAFDLVNFINKKNITKKTSENPLFEDEVTLDSGFSQEMLNEVERMRGACAKMVASVNGISCQDFFMYFVNRLQEAARDFSDFINASGESVLQEGQIRTLLSKMQITFIKILAIYEIYKSRQFPPINFLTEYMETHRKEVLSRVENEIVEYNKKDLFHLEPKQEFQSWLVEYLNLIHLKTIKLLFSYFTIFSFSGLNITTKEYILDCIARVLLHIYKIQERMDGSTQTVLMKPDDLLHYLYKIFSELQIFITFTSKYTGCYQFDLSSDRVAEMLKQPEENAPRGTVEFFISRECEVCNKLFRTELWGFLQELTKTLSLRIKLFDIYTPENEALCKGIYEINRIPTIKFNDRIYWINPAEQKGGDPHITVKRELLNFFNVLGVYVGEDIIEKGTQEGKKGNMG